MCVSACGGVPDARPTHVTAPQASAQSTDGLELVYTHSFDSQSALTRVQNTLFESGWHGLQAHRVVDGKPATPARVGAAGRAPIDSNQDPVFEPLTDFALAQTLDSRLMRIDEGAASPRWSSGACTRFFAATRFGNNVYLNCENGVVVLSAETGAIVRTIPVGETTYMDEHRIVSTSDGVVARVGDKIIAIGSDGRVRFHVALTQSFGLAVSGDAIVVAQNGNGLIFLSLQDGRETRRIAIPNLSARPDPFSSRLGSVIADGDMLWLAAEGTLRAFDATTGNMSWSAPVGNAHIVGDTVYACSGPRVLALRRSTGDRFWSFSVGECEIVDAWSDKLLVRFSATPPQATSEDLEHAGLMLFRRTPHAPACETATVHGVVRLDGAPVAGVRVSIGAAQSTNADGTVSFWASRAPQSSSDAADSHVATTDANGRYSLTFCDRGNVPAIVDHADLAHHSSLPEFRNEAGYVFLNDRHDYTRDFNVVGEAREM